MMRLCTLLVAFACVCPAQSTQGLITGTVRDSQSGRPVGSGQVTWHHAETGTSGAAAIGSNGAYTLPALSPGTYSLRVAAPEYQPQEAHELPLSVAGTLELDFRLRPLHDVWEQGIYRSIFLPGSNQILNFFGPDLDGTRAGTFQERRANLGALEATISDVIDPVMIRDLPFAGRDIYAALVLMPGATSDSGTSRGLGLVVNGQRPSSSTFYLDGVEANNYLTAGPSVVLPPEAVQEYRFSTNNFSPQYGATTGFIANAVTRAGGDSFHGSAFGFVQNSLLNANDFQRNRMGWGRPSGKVAEFGFQVGGPVLKRKPLFFSTLYDRVGTRTEKSPIAYRLPTAAFLSSLPSNSVAYRLLTEHPSPASSVPDADLTANLSLAAPVTIRRHTALERADYGTADGRHRLALRVALGRVSQPDFVWSPYAGLNTELRDTSVSTMLSHSFNITPRLVNEARAGFALAHLRWERMDTSVPNLNSGAAYLPGSPALYDYKNAMKSWQFIDNLIWTKGRHIVTAGGSYLQRGLNGYMTSGGVGAFDFLTLRDFANDAPFLYRASRSYVSGAARALPDYYRAYRARDFALFAQDTFRVSPRLALNLGLRMERFGSPYNRGGNRDIGIAWGDGASLADRLRNATLDTSGRERMYSATVNWGPRVGVSYDVSGQGSTILRASFGILYDRLLDNLWQTSGLNDLASAQWISFPTASVNYLAPIDTVLRSFTPTLSTGPRFTLFESTLPAGRSYNYFAGVQQRLTGDLTVEINALGARGRDLLTTDVVNRSPTAQLPAVLNARLPFDIWYRGPQGVSDYHALTAALRYRSRFAHFRLNYTWSHSIDIQSNPLEGNPYDLTGSVANMKPAGFARQFDSAGDRGSSDFDQRHNLVFYSVWELPAARRANWTGRLLQNWRFAQLAAFRTGFPFSIYGTGGRVDILDPAANTMPAQPAPGGVLVLNRANFVNARAGSGQNSGRNAFRGPGLYNLDISVARTFALPRESTRLVFRADAFNFLNHANLNSPGNFFLNPATFGISQYGRAGFDTGFPASAPLNETARRIQLGIRFEF